MDPSTLAAVQNSEISFPELNAPQARAVAHVNGPLLIFAGAGSGKTRVIVYRIANLVAVHRVPPFRILAVTFTNKAAKEMKQRLEALINPDVVRDLWVGTFHAICVQLLRRHYDAAGLDRNFVIYDDADQRAVIQRVFKEHNLDDRRYPPRQVLARIHAEKQEGRGPDDFQRQGYFDDAILRCFEAYEQKLRAANALDFDDLLLRVLRVAEDPQNLAGDDIRNRFRHVLVDEFQDVNQVQYRLVRALCRTHDNLCVVGDDDQSIYRWRGADVRIVRGFQRDFPQAAVVKLEQNYRSSGHIVRGALGVIRPAEAREPKELWTANRDGEPITIVTADSEHDEAACVADGIRQLMERGLSAHDIAVFYRIHAQSRVLEEVLRAERIPYQIIGGQRFFERAEVKDLLSYLRIIANPQSDVDLHRIINVPSRKIGATTVDKLIRKADELGTSLYDAIVPIVQTDALAVQTRRSLLAFRDLLQGLIADMQTMSPSALVREVLDRSGYAKMLEKEESATADVRLQNLRELLQSIVDYEEEVSAAGETATLNGYLERVTLSSDVDGMEDAPKVAMMTVHAAKGLEFRAVFMTGMEEDLFPLKSQDPTADADIEEERRLAYVAITRAKERLFITHTARRAIFGQTRYGLPSRFLADLPRPSVRSTMTSASQLMQRRLYPLPMSTSSRSTSESTSSRSPWSHPQTGSVMAMKNPSLDQREMEWSEKYPGRRMAPGERYVERDVGADDGCLQRGARVKNDRFGVGVVQSVDDGPDPIVTVKFPGWGNRRIKATYLRTLSES